MSGVEDDPRDDDAHDQDDAGDLVDAGDQTRPGPVAFESDPETMLALAQFGLRAGKTLQELSGPLEILGNLIYLASVSLDDSTKLREYLSEAEELAGSVGKAYTELLRTYPVRRAAK